MRLGRGAARATRKRAVASVGDPRVAATKGGSAGTQLVGIGPGHQLRAGRPPSDLVRALTVTFYASQAQGCGYWLPVRPHSPSEHPGTGTLFDVVADCAAAKDSSNFAGNASNIDAAISAATSQTDFFGAGDGLSPRPSLGAHPETPDSADIVGPFDYFRCSWRLRNAGTSRELGRTGKAGKGKAEKGPMGSARLWDRARVVIVLRGRRKFADWGQFVADRKPAGDSAAAEQAGRSVGPASPFAPDSPFEPRHRSLAAASRDVGHANAEFVACRQEIGRIR